MVQVTIFVETTTLNNLREEINAFLRDNKDKIEYVDLKISRPHASNAIAVLVYKIK